MAMKTEQYVGQSDGGNSVPGPMLPHVEKLTNWKNEPSVADLKSDLEAAKPAQQAMIAKIKKWRELRDVEGPYKPKKVRNRSQVQPKLVRRNNEWRYSALTEPFLSSDKLWNVSPRTWEDKEGAVQNELVLNYQADTEFDKVDFIDEYVRTAVDDGTVITKLGWERETRIVKRSVPVFSYYEIASQEEADAFQEALALREENPRGFDELPEEMIEAVNYYDETGMATVAYNTGDVTEVEEEELVENRPTAEVWDPENCFIDPSCKGKVEKAKFVIFSFETTKAALLKDKRYKNLKAVNWSGNKVLSQPDHETNTPNDFALKDDLRSPVVAYEYWGYIDINGTEELTPIVATWIGDIMIRMELNPFPDEKHPVVVSKYLPKRKSVMGEADAELLEDSQAIIGALMRGMIDLLGRSANSQTGTAKGFLDVTNQRRYDRGEDYQFNPGNGDPRLAIYQHSYPEIPNSALTMLNLQNHEAESLSGVKAFAGGLSGEAYGEVAAGIKGMLDASAKREMAILRRLASGISKIGAKFSSMNAVFLSDEETVRITNEKFVTVRREDLKGRFDFKVDIATAEVDEAKASDLGLMLQTMGPNMDPAMARKILAEIARLKRMPELAHEIANYEPQPDPIEEKRRELEILKLEAEVEKLKAEAAEERAKAAKANAEADLAELQFVEDESGTTHARDMQKLGAQADSLNHSEITKALLKPSKEGETSPDIDAAIGYAALNEQAPGAAGAL